MWRQSDAQRIGLVNRGCPADSRRLRLAEFFSRCAPLERQGVESLDGGAVHSNQHGDWSPADHPASDLVLLHRGPGFVPHCAGCERRRGGQSGVPSDQSDPAGCRSLAPIGTYDVESYQRPCDGNCGSLDATTDQCNLQIDVASGAEVFLTASFAPGEGCSIAQTETALQSPVPDLFAFREPYEDCGLDFSLEMVGDVPGQGRTYFAEANNGGRTAELSAYEAGATAGSPDFIVYRTNADGSVDVFLPNLGRESDGPWRHYVCSGLRPDAVQGFVLDGCTDPVEIDP